MLDEQGRTRWTEIRARHPLDYLTQRMHVIKIRITGSFDLERLDMLQLKESYGPKLNLK
jgi:hypothetical protein